MNCARRALGLAVIAVSVPALVAQKPALEKRKDTRFIRIESDEAGRALGMQTAIVRYVPESGDSELAVDLIAAVHLADPDYFRALQRRFEDYDVVLYELVAPPGAVPERQALDSGNPLAMLQQMASGFLGLGFQLDHIDYRRDNFVHADLSPQGMLEGIAERGDNPLTVALGVTADLLRQLNNAEGQHEAMAAELQDLDMMELMFDPLGPAKLKRVLAKQLVGAATPGAGLPRTLETILVDDRNKAAMAVFQKELAKGRERIAIFYGAAHMPDFERRLRLDFGMKLDRVRWLTAWDLGQGTTAGFPGVLKMLQEMAQPPQPAPPKPATKPRKRRRIVV